MLWDVWKSIQIKKINCVLRIYKNVTIKRNIVVNKNVFSKCISVRFIKNLDKSEFVLFIKIKNKSEFGLFINTGSKSEFCTFIKKWE